MAIIIIIIFFLGCFLMIFIERNLKIPFSKWIFIIPFTLMIANRRIEVPDTQPYKEFFLLTDTNIKYFNDSGFEVGFQLYSKIIKIFVSKSYTWYFALITLTNLLIIDFALNRIVNIFKKDRSLLPITDFSQETSHFEIKNTYTILPLTLYVAFFGLYFNAIVLRVGISLSLLVLTSYFAIKPNKRLTDWLLIFFLLVFEYFFHTTALIGILIVLILVYSKQLSFKSYFRIWLVIGLVYFTNIMSRLGGIIINFISSLNNLTMLSNKLDFYGDNSVFNDNRISNKFMFYWLFCFIIIKLIRSGTVFYKYLNVYLTGLAIFAVFRAVLLVERVTDFFLLFSIVIFYLFLIQMNKLKFWMYFFAIVIIQVFFVMRIINIGQ